MSLKLSGARRVAVGAAIAALSVPGSALADTDTTLNYSCDIPIVGPQPVTARVTTNIPLTFPVRTLTPAFNINVQARAAGDTFLGLLTVGAAPGFISGTASAKARLIQPTGQVLPLTIPITIPKTATPAEDPGPAGVLIPAVGQTPQVQFIAVGTAEIYVDGISLNLLAQDASSANIGGLGSAADSDGNADTFDVPCAGPSGGLSDSVKLADVTVNTGTPTPLPGTPTPLPGTPSPTPPATPPTPTATPLPTPVGTPTPTVAPPTPTPLPTPIGTPTPTVAPPTLTPTPLPPTPLPTPVGTPTPTPTPTPAPDSPIRYGYAIAGSAVLKGLTTGTIAVTGSGIYNLQLVAGAAPFSGKTTLNPASAKLTAVRLLPITAQIAFLEVGPTTGTLENRTLVATTKQSIQIRSAKVFGFNLVTNTCRTATPSTITLKSAAQAFQPLTGGTISGTFAISQLRDCGVLNNLVSGLTASSGNPISVKLTPKPV